MNRPTLLLREVLINYSIITRTAIERDLRVIEDRFKNEGMSFLTITLPTLDDALLRGLTEGRLTPSMFPGFKPWKRGGSLPAFMVGLFRRVFEADGLLKVEPCLDSIEAIRQVARLFKKIELPCSPARIKKAFERFKKNEQELSDNSHCGFATSSVFTTVAGYLWSDLELRASDIYCSPGVFGSGATAERYRLHERYTVRQWPTRGENYFPASYHTSHTEWDVDSFNEIDFLSGREERPVRVVTVPKTLKTPRIIAVEPSYMMLRQQSIWRYLRNYLEGGSFPFKSIRFSSQEENRKLARAASADGSLATIDLSDASDRVSTRVVALTFKSCPSFLRMIFGARTRQAVLPDGELLNLRKFASMGSALCFPIESMVFFTVVLASLVRQSGKRPSRGLLVSLSKSVAVYGDDIIVPAKMAAGVMEDLQATGLLVNHDKSFTTGFFRESCGGDYYKGSLNTPIYVRRLEKDSSKRLDATDVAAYISLSNQFYMKGLWHVSQYIRDYLKRRNLDIGRSTEAIGGLTYYSCVFTDVKKWCRKTHRYLVRSVQLRESRRRDPIDTVRGAMLYAFGSSERKRELNWRGVHIPAIEKRMETFDFQNSGECPDADFSPYDIAPGGAYHGGGLREWVREPLPLHTSRVPSGIRVIRSTRGDLAHGRAGESRVLRAVVRSEYDGTSVRPYALSSKRRLTPTPVGLKW